MLRSPQGGEWIGAVATVIDVNQKPVGGIPGDCLRPEPGQFDMCWHKNMNYFVSNLCLFTVAVYRPVVLERCINAL